MRGQGALMTSWIDRLDGINRLIGNAVCWLALAMSLVQFVIVLLRYTFGISSIAINESVLYMNAALFMLTAGYALLVNGHVRVDVFYGRMSSKARDRVDLFGHAFLLIPSMLTFLYWTWSSARNSWKILEGPISVGGIPAVFLLKTLIPAFCVLLLLQSVIEIARILSGRRAAGSAEVH
jgi:TRAP-type mannitol/chloroaromatic compound transport system permease small subunit